MKKELNYKEIQLIPCPFCGGQITDDSYDRREVFKCIPCGWQRTFDGLLTKVKNDKPIPYVDKEGKDIKPKDVKYQEYYHHENIQKAINKMNTRHERLDKQAPVAEHK